MTFRGYLATSYVSLYIRTSTILFVVSEHVVTSRAVDNIHGFDQRIQLEAKEEQCNLLQHAY